MKFFANIIVLIVLLTTIISAQDKNVGIGTTTPNASAILDLTATDKGLLIPRLTTAQRDVIVNPAKGLMIFDSTANKFQYRFGNSWITMMTSNSLNEAYVGGKSITVNNGAVQLNGSNAADETLKIFNTANGGAVLIENIGIGNSLRVNDDASDTSPFIIDANGNVGIGTTTPTQKLTLEGNLGIIETGTTPTFHTIFQGGDQAGDITYTLPTAAPTVNGQVLSSTIAGVMSWVNGGGGGSTAISSLTNAASTNSIDNLNHSQTWDWSTANNQNALSFSANAITSGTILDITSTSGSENSTNGLLRVFNNSASTNGIVFRAQSNSTAGSGLTVLASGNIGIGIAAPAQKLAVEGTFGILEGGTSPTYHTIFQGGDQADNITYILPATQGAASTFLQNDGSGNLSWASAGSGSATLSSLTSATGTNTLNNANWAQIWNWPTATTEIPMLLTANTITSGTILDITTTSGSENSTNGLFRVFNNSASTNGIVFRAQSNSTAGSGLTVLASGNIGIGIAAPAQKLAVEGTFGILEGGTSPTYHTIFQGGDQADNITYILPATQGAPSTYLQNDGSGNLTWASAGSGSATLSSLTSATATNTLNNANFAQIWNWPTATTEVPMTITANTLTSGTILDITSTSGSENSTNGLLRVFNNSTSTNGIIFRAQSNSTAGTGLTVLASGNIGIGTVTPGSTLDLKGTMRYSGVSSGNIEITAPATVTSYSLILPAAQGAASTFLQNDGSGNLSWATGGSGSASLSSLTAATAVNSINNANWAQTWNWNSATTEIPLALSANAITTGTILDITSSYASGNSTTGLLRVANTGSGTSGIIFRAQSNSTAGSGLTVYADGNIGVATSTVPTSKLGVNGSIALPIKTVIADYTATIDDYTILVNVNTATISLPQASTCTSRIYVIKKIASGSGSITIDPNASELIDGAATNILLATQWRSITIQTDGTSWYLIGLR